MNSKKELSTMLIHGGITGDERTGAVTVPIYQTSTFHQDAPGVNRGYEYSRTGNPTREALEKLIADLEGGSAGFAFASGMAAITAVLSLFRAGDKVLISKNVYGGTFRVLDQVFDHFDISYEIVDTANMDALEEAIRNDLGDGKGKSGNMVRPQALMIETPANPLLTVTDISAASEVAHKYGIKVIVDNTFMTPYLQRPLLSGADIVVHSATKFLGGHSDLVAGLVVVDDEKLAEKIAFIQNSTGGILGPFDSFLLMRGIRTLGVRMDRHVANAEKVAEFLGASTEVKHVYYPGLDDSPDHDINMKQAVNGGAMISFELSDGLDAAGFYKKLRLITLAESLGGVESLICHPAKMTHACIPEDIRKSVGITDNLMRLSVGIENAEDIIDDLRQAMEQ